MKISALLLSVLVAAVPASAASKLIKLDVALRSGADASASKLIASNSVVSSAGQKAEVAVNDMILRFVANLDDVGVITTSIELARRTADGKNNVLSMPTIKTLSGQPAQVRIDEQYQVDLLATVIEPPGFSFDFPGGTVEQLLATLAKGDNPTFNLVGTKEQLALPLPAFSLRSADAPALAAALDKLLRPSGASVEPSDNRAGLTTKPIFVLRSIPRNLESPSLFDCFLLGPLLDRYTPEQVASAIQTAWELDPNFNKNALHLKYHRETQLLFVVGNSAPPVAVAGQIYRTLLQQQKTPAPNAPATDPKP